jgi:hypothetical protein
MKPNSIAVEKATFNDLDSIVQIPHGRIIYFTEGILPALRLNDGVMVLDAGAGSMSHVAPLVTKFMRYMQ